MIFEAEFLYELNQLKIDYTKKPVLKQVFIFMSLIFINYQT